MFKRMVKTITAVLAGGFRMWVLAGLWHNLILPAVNKDVEALHDGLVLMFVAYLILSGLMTWFYTKIKKEIILLAGLGIGALIGILWVFPHGLTMAAVHDSSVLYEVRNAMWHCAEQGAGGVIIALIKKNESLV